MRLKKIQAAYLIHQGLISFFAGIEKQFKNLMQTGNINAKTADAFLMLFEQHIKDLSGLKFQIGRIKSSGYAELENLNRYCREEMTLYEVQHCLKELDITVQQAEQQRVADEEERKRQEELRRQEELKKQEELKRQERERKRLEEERKRQEELKRQQEEEKKRYADNCDGTITDRATGLMWDKSGSSIIDYKEAEAYVEKLNRDKFAGYKDWRLPTVDELKALLTEEKQSNGMYIDPIFDEEIVTCWSSDQRSVGRVLDWALDWTFGRAQSVSLAYGFVDWNHLDSVIYVRAVRSI